MRDYLIWIVLGAFVFLVLAAPLSGWAARKALRIWPESGRRSLPFEIAILTSLLLIGIWMTRAAVTLHREDWGKVIAILGAMLTVPTCFIMSLIGASRGIDREDEANRG